MITKITLPSLIAAATLSLAATGLPAKTAAAQDTPQIYGSQLMTQQERFEHRRRMQNAETLEERERVRAEHHERMAARAKERGVTLPDEPPARGMGQGTRQGQGMRQGQGQGMGQGRGMGLRLGQGSGRRKGN